MTNEEYGLIAEKLLSIDVAELERQDSPFINWCIYASAILATASCLCLCMLAGGIAGDLYLNIGVQSLGAWIIILSATSLTGFLIASRLMRSAARLEVRQELIKKIETKGGFLWQLHFLLREAITIDAEKWNHELFSDALIASAQGDYIHPDLYVEILRAARGRLVFCSATREHVLTRHIGEQNDC